MLTNIELQGAGGWNQGQKIVRAPGKGQGQLLLRNVSKLLLIIINE